jgi:hypothetical protein
MFGFYGHKKLLILEDKVGKDIFTLRIYFICTAHIPVPTELEVLARSRLRGPPPPRRLSSSAIFFKI